MRWPREACSKNGLQGHHGEMGTWVKMSRSFGGTVERPSLISGGKHYSADSVYSISIPKTNLQLAECIQLE